MEQRYGHKVQRLCKTLGFRLIKSNQLRDLDQVPLENIISEVEELAPMMTSLVFSDNLTLKSPLTSYSALIKLLAIFIIICRLAH